METVILAYKQQFHVAKRDINTVSVPPNLMCYCFAGKFGEKTDYGGFEYHAPRSGQQHREHVEMCQTFNSDAERSQFQRKHGVRYTDFVRLPYVDLVRMTIVDPMHNLFLGTARFMFKELWSSRHNLNEKKILGNIQQLVDMVKVPQDIGRIPRKIASNFASFTADQWKNWTLYYSLVALKSHLPKEAYEIWSHFVQACHILCKPVLRMREVAVANEKLMAFCRGIDTYYGSIIITPNMHLHRHLIECINDFGPMYAFWLFSFERYNGLLGGYPSNNKCPEPTLCRRFVRDQTTRFAMSDNWSAEFLECFDSLERPEVGSLLSVELTYDAVKTAAALVSGDVPSGELLSGVDVTRHGGLKTGLIAGTHLEYLQTSIHTIWDGVDITSVSGAFRWHDTVVYAGEKYGSGYNHGNVLASWCGVDGAIDTSGQVRPGQIVQLLYFNVSDASGTQRQVDVAYVKWYQRHIAHDYFQSHLATVWTAPSLCCEPDGPASFIPIKRIAGHFIEAPLKINGENVVIVIKRQKKIVW